MAAANENQGLKIAVAVFATLWVIFAVTTYFGFDGYSKTDAKLSETNKKLDDANKSLSTLQNQFNDLQELAGYAKADPANLKDVITKDFVELNKKAGTILDDNRKLVEAYKGAGGNTPKIDELRQAGDTILSGISQEPGRSLQSMVARMLELCSNQSQFATQLGLDFLNTRKMLEAADQSNKAQLDIQIAEVTKAKEDLTKTHGDYEKDYSAVRTKVDNLTTETAQKAQEIQKLKNQIAQSDEDNRKAREVDQANLRNLRELVDKKETVLDQPDGHVTFVDYGRGEIRTDIKRNMGARPQMVMSIFDRNAPGVPTEKPKGTVEFLQVGESGSVARIINTFRTIDPIRVGDIVYSAAWSPNSPQRFALIGKIDVDRDGRDDREDLKRMIRAAGGVIDYDLPPTGIGKETGKLTGMTTWYVTDERSPIHPPVGSEARRPGDDDKEFLDKRNVAVRTASLSGVHPITVERLLSQLGYTFGARKPGLPEAIDRTTSELLTNPKGRLTAPPPGAGTPPAADKPAAEPDDMPKDDKPK